MKELFYKIIGAAMDVHRFLRWGLLEAIYQEALSIELKNRLSKGEVKFSFRKLNDRLRRARGTVDLNTILKENPDFGEWDKEY